MRKNEYQDTNKLSELDTVHEAQTDFFSREVMLRRQLVLWVANSLQLVELQTSMARYRTQTPGVALEICTEQSTRLFAKWLFLL